LVKCVKSSKNAVEASPRARLRNKHAH